MPALGSPHARYTLRLTNRLSSIDGDGSCAASSARRERGRWLAEPTRATTIGGYRWPARRRSRAAWATPTDRGR